MTSEEATDIKAVLELIVKLLQRIAARVSDIEEDTTVLNGIVTTSLAREDET